MIREMKDRGMINREIAGNLGISRNTVSKLLRTTRLADHRKRKRGSKLDPYRERIRALVDDHNLSAVRILEEIRKIGYNGGYTILKEYCHELRKDRRIQAVYRYETEPGKQSQVDFGEFGHIDIDGKRRLMENVSLEDGISVQN
ncbi:hypothetical protein [Acidiplasma sp.]|uniref:hypothetical protein n=1 Tax=Acidiplasma sp. TaxID=1872114 RepID=UPI002585D779|nr:hypothetical protein [Acidiplasma sp.]